MAPKGSKGSSKSSKKGSKVESAASMMLKANGVETGISHWYQLYDDNTCKYYFYNLKTKQTSWGLPLCDSVPDRERLAHGKDDWECCIDPESGKKFFQSKKYGKVQWTVPLMYRGRIANLSYFKERRISTVGASPVPEHGRPALKRQASLSQLVKNISIEQVLDDDTCCAAFHRFLVATHAEENLLFWGAAEVFRKGEWKGMKVIGVESQVESKDGDNEGETMLQSQLAATRASTRMGWNIRQAAHQEARLIFDRFLKVGASMEICVERKVATQIEEDIVSNAASIEGRTLFEAAQEEVTRNMEEDSLPRFLKVALSPENEVVGQKDFTFQGDAVVRNALKRVAGLSDE